MRNRKFTTLALLGMTAGVCLYANEVKAEGKCSAGTCQTAEQCQKETAKDTESSFAGSLSANSQDLFQKFTADQKKQAISLTDGNKMSADDAVAQVDNECRCGKPHK